MKTITVQTSDYNTSTVEISVEKQLFWSSGRPYTLQDYVIFSIKQNKQ
jgi:hypothetical protein